MDQNNRPHGREKTVGSGSAGVEKGEKVNTGSRPVGSGGRGSSEGGGRRTYGAFSPRPQQQQSQYNRGQVPQLNLKKLLIIAALIFIAWFAIKSCFGGSGGYPSDYTQAYNETTAVYPGQTTAPQNYTSAPAQTTVPQLPTTVPAAVTATQPPANDTQVDPAVSPLARGKRVTPLGGGRDIVTVMVYMCGTDLESKYGMATKDLQEMLDAKISDKINLIIETGGCRQWQNNAMASNRNQIYKIESQGLIRLEDNVGTAAMTDPANLTDFIKYCNEHYPADRNILILWDHGGGSLSGYGYDEKYSSTATMTLSKIDTALKDAGCTFDWIGFDACLMATLETALVCNNYADYLIASEELEPGTGWDYTSWLKSLSANTSLSTVQLSQVIIDNFVIASRMDDPNAQVTLSIIDLAELQGAIPDAFREFASSTNELLNSNNYQQVSNARAGVRQFAKSNKINQVDLVDLALRIGTNESKKLAEALQGCVKYNRATMSRCYGVSIYFPYESVSSVKNAVASYNELGIDSEYTKCIQSFASLEYGGQITGSASQGYSSGGDLLGTLLGMYSDSGSSTSPLAALMGSFLGGGSSSASSSSSAGLSIDPSLVMSLLQGFSGRSMPAGYEWVDTQLVADQAANIAANYIDVSHITATNKGGRSVLSLTDDEWKLIQSVELNVFVEDEDGYIDLGLDNTFEWLDNDLLLEYDGTWLTLNGNICAYYLVSDTQQDDGSWTTVGRIPALLNGEFVNLQVIFGADSPAGAVTGAYPLYEDESIDVFAKGDIPVAAGDTIELLCDFYNADGTYASSHKLGSSFTVPQSGLALTNLKVDAEGLDVTYRLTDVYGNHYWLPVNF